MSISYDMSGKKNKLCVGLVIAILPKIGELYPEPTYQGCFKWNLSPINLVELFFLIFFLFFSEGDSAENLFVQGLHKWKEIEEVDLVDWPKVTDKVIPVINSSHYKVVLCCKIGLIYTVEPRCVMMILL